MELLLELKLDVDSVLRGQGADPSILRSRNPRLAQVAERALEEARPLLQPRLLYRCFAIEKMRHNRVFLEGGASIRGDLLARHLGPARQVIAILCTIGPHLEELSARVIAQEPVRGLALNGAGSAAIEALANAACHYFERQAAAQDWQTTIPLSPGMLGWEVETGQPQIFNLLDGAQIGVTLNPKGFMLPLKSLSLLIGQGPDLVRKGTTCDYCSMKPSCRYQDHYASTYA